MCPGASTAALQQRAPGSSLSLNHPLSPHLPPFIAGLFRGWLFGKEQAHFSLLLAAPGRNHQEVVLATSFQVPWLPGPALRGFRKFNYENLLDLHADLSRPVISLPPSGGL